MSRKRRLGACCGEAEKQARPAHPCGKEPGFCPKKKRTNPLRADTKSDASHRVVGVPAELIRLLEAHREEQATMRSDVGTLWQDGDWVFTHHFGRPLNPNSDYHRWKDLLVKAGVRDARLHDARHTAATMLLLLGVPERSIPQSAPGLWTPRASREQVRTRLSMVTSHPATKARRTTMTTMTTQQVDPATVSTSDADDCLSIAEINYLLQTRQIDHVILADTTVVSLDGLRAYRERHVGYDPDDRPWLDVSWSEGAFPWEMGHRKQQSASTNAVVL